MAEEKTWEPRVSQLPSENRAYESRERLAEDVVRVLREEFHFLLAAGAALVQFDEPVLSEVVFTGAKSTRSFMCGALSEKVGNWGQACNIAISASRPRRLG